VTKVVGVFVRFFVRRFMVRVHTKAGINLKRQLKHGSGRDTTCVQSESYTRENHYDRILMGSCDDFF
jgi:hypothetical protein